MMQVLRLLFSPFGRLQPQGFVCAAIAVYAAGVASQWLTAPNLAARGGLYLFAIAQAALIWAWYALHAKRLRDAGHGPGLAAAASALYALAVVLLLILAFAFFPTSNGATDVNATSALGLILLLSIMASLSGSASYDFGQLIVALLTVLAFMPVVVALAVTLWAATRPSAKAPLA